MHAATIAGRVSIEEDGRSGTVRYHEAGHTIDCYWEFGAGDTVVLIDVGMVDEWAKRYPWATGRRAAIIERIASEVLRLRAPSCHAELDDARGVLKIVSGNAESGAARSAALAASVPQPLKAPPPAPSSSSSSPATFVRTYANVRAKFAIGAGLIVAILGIGAGLIHSVFSIRTYATRVGMSARSGNIIATFTHQLEPYVPSLHRDPSKDRYTVGILIHTADGSQPPRHVEVARHLTGADANKATFGRDDGQRLWFRVLEPGAIDLASGTVLGEREFATIAALEPSPTGRIEDLASGDRALEMLLSAGGLVTPTRFLAVMNDADATRDLGPRESVRPTLDDARSREPSSMWTSDVVTEDGRHLLVAPVRASAPPAYFSAFLRESRYGGLLRANGPSGVFRILEKVRYPRGTVFLARVDDDGTTRWETDLGIATLEEVLPDSQRPAFIGLRPTTPNVLAEPILVVVDAATGKATTYSLERGRR
ncbi:MAG: hypothetical protein JNM94_14560 [Phycisphaerae bacterium]|nr:hypothetical protein [Phycisphaerae bacterium]